MHRCRAFVTICHKLSRSLFFCNPKLFSPIIISPLYNDTENAPNIGLKSIIVSFNDVRFSLSVKVDETNEYIAPESKAARNLVPFIEMSKTGNP